MRGHVYKRSSNSWTVKVPLGKDPVTGRHHSQYETVKGNKKAAEQRLSEMLHEIDTGTFMKPGKTSVADFLKQWPTDYAKPNVSRRTFERYSGIVDKYFIPEFGSITLTQLKPGHLQRFYSTLTENGLSAATVHYCHSVIHKALKTALKWGLVNRNAADGVDVPRIRKTEMQIWDESEVTQFIEATKDSQYYALFHAFLFTGMRRSEALALRWQDVDFIFSQLYISRTLHHLKDGSYVFSQPKSARSRRTIALSPDAIQVLRDHREDQEKLREALGQSLTDEALVFCNEEGKPWRPNTITRAWQTLAKRAGVKVIRLHDARHTHASLMLKAGIHPKVVQERLGHASIQMTLDTYSHVSPGIQQAAAASFDKLINPGRKTEAIEKL